MTLPSNVRSLFAFGAFCAVGGAWLTLVTEVRTWPLRDETSAAFAAPAPENASSDRSSGAIENTAHETGDDPREMSGAVR
ncbi:MAG TPA: hypothetical protein VK550_01530 [Polyangiaceae bacterium]|jgi:hypothetical protein|nr:hypothetical protein [Polyangiaceae bacterium]